jgi:hypothetical protein
MTRHTKRLIALASMVVALLGTLLVAPAAMASTAGSGPGPGQGFGPGPGPIAVQIGCPPLLHGKPINLKAFRNNKVFRRLLKRHPRRPVQIRINCSVAVSVSVPVAQACQPRTLVFDATAASSTLTEVSGPTLAPAQEFSYAGNIYTIMSVNPGADSFTVFLDNSLFVAGSNITNGHGTLLCSPVAGH